MIWIGLFVMILTIAVSASLLRSSRGDALGIPLIALGSFTFLFVMQPLQLIRTGTLELFLSDWEVTKSLLISALMLAFFMWGWLRTPRSKPEHGYAWSPELLWNIGLASACVGLTFYVIFLERSGGFSQAYSQGHGAAMAWKDNTAYLYDGPWLVLSGSVMMILAAGRNFQRREWKTYIPLLFLAAFFVDAILGGDRGPLFSVTSATFISVSLARRWQVKLKWAACFLAILGCVIAFVFANRGRIHLGMEGPSSTESTGDALIGLLGTSQYEEEHGMVAQEFLYHSAAIEAVDATKKLDFGVTWVEFFLINPIPKVLWPEKAIVFWPGVTSGDIFEQTSIVIAPGSAPGIVADLYERFHIFSVLFLFALGSVLRRLFVSARHHNSPLMMVGYVMTYALSLNMFAQGFGAIFVPLPYSMVPVVIFALVTRRNERKALARRQQGMILRRIGDVHGEQWSS